MAETHSKRATRFWTRLTQWYGARLTQQYGELVTDDVAELVDDASNDVVQQVLANLRAKHVTHPPTFLELDQLFRVARKPSAVARTQSEAEKLAAWAVRNRDLSGDQIRMPWRYFEGGVEIPAAGGKPGYQITVQDMQFDRGESEAKDRGRLDVSQLMHGDWAGESPFPKEFR